MLILCLMVSNVKIQAQEINAKVTVVSAQVGNTIDKRVFQNLQTALVAFINKRKWTTDVF